MSSDIADYLDDWCFNTLPRHADLPANSSDALSFLRQRQREHEQWQHRLLQGEAVMSDDPWRLQPVLRIYQEQGSALDLRTGLAWRASEGSPPWIKALALPQELFATAA